METLTTISDLLETYESSGATMFVPELLTMQDTLAVQSYRLAEEAATAKGKLNGKIFVKKVNINRQMQALLNAKLSKAAAQVQAESSVTGEEMIKAELDAEAYAYRLDLLLGQVNRVLSALQQRISYLKNEKNNTHA